MYTAPQKDCTEALSRCVGRRKKKLNCSWNDAFTSLIREQKYETVDDEIKTYLSCNFGIDEQSANDILKKYQPTSSVEDNHG